MKKDKVKSPEELASGKPNQKSPVQKKNTRRSLSPETATKELRLKLKASRKEIRSLKSILAELQDELAIAVDKYNHSGEEYFQSIFENSSSAIAIMEPDTTISTVNEAYCRMTGYTKPEIIGTSWTKQIPPYDLQRLKDYNRRRLKNPKDAPEQYEFSFYKKNGEIRHALMSISLIQSSRKTVTSFVDITEWKLAELAVKESEEKYRVFLNATEDIAFLKNEKLQYLISNPSNTAFLSKTESEIIGKTDFDLMPEVMAEQCFKSDLFAMGSDKIIVNEEKVHNEIFETRKFRVPLPGENVGVGAYIRNVTAQRRAEQLQKVLYTISNAVNTTKDIAELIELVREQLDTLLDTSNFFIAFYDEQTGMLSLPYSADEKDTITTLPAEKSATGFVIRNNRSLLATEDDFRKLYASGEIKEIGSPAKVWLGVPLCLEGKVIGAIVVQNYHDPEAYTMDDVEMLEFVSHQISNSIQRKRAEEDLKSALVKAEESDRLKSTFLANLSHEIRTPMNAILGFSSLLENEAYDKAEQSNFISIIQKSSKQLLGIITDIIDISKIVNNQVTINKTKFNLNSLLENLLIAFNVNKSSMNKDEISLVLSKSESVVPIFLETDEIRLGQIFNNLLYNALKFTMKGLIKFGYTEEDGKLVFFVEDTGIGIAEDKQEIIFIRFRQEDESQSATYGGSGLGLSISKGLIELLGGSIWLKSEKGKGSTFYFTLHESAFIDMKSRADNQNQE